MAENRCGQSLEEGVGVSGHTVSGAGPSCSRDAAPGLDHWWAHRDTVQNHLDSSADFTGLSHLLVSLRWRQGQQSVGNKTSPHPVFSMSLTPCTTNGHLCLQMRAGPGSQET